MTFSVETLKGQLSGGGARANKFEVVLSNKVDSDADEKFRFTCKAASLPVSEIGAIDVYYKGRAVKFIGDRPPFPNWTVTVYNDNDFLVRNAFERWMSAMNQHVGNVMDTAQNITVDPNSYKSDANVKQFSMDDATSETGIKLYKMIGMFPVRLGEIALDWETTNAIETFEVEFAYDYWTSEGTTDDPSTAAT